MPPRLTKSRSPRPVMFGVNVGHGLAGSDDAPVVMPEPGLMNAVNSSETSRPRDRSSPVTAKIRLCGILSLTARVNIAWQKFVIPFVSPQWPSLLPTRLNGYDGSVAVPV